MDRTTPTPLKQSQTPQPKGRGSPAENQGETTKSTEHEFEHHQSGVDHGHLSISFLASPSRSGQLVPVNRPQLVRPEIPLVGALTRANVRQLQTSLEDRTPMARWEAESMDIGFWHHLGMIVSEHDAHTLSLKPEGSMK
jgi:hypothetical protein